MIGDSALPEIISKQSHGVRKDWIKDQVNKLKGLNVHDKNLKVSRVIDSINEKIEDVDIVHDEFVDIEDDEDNHSFQLSFEF